MHVLMIEDHENDYLLLRRCAERIDGVRLAWCSTLAQGMDYLDTQAVDVVLLDMTLSDAHGLPMLDRLYTQHPALPVIVLSISEDDELALRAVQHRAQDYLVKGHFNEEILKRALRYAVERKRIEHALDTERRLVRTLIDSVPDYIFVKDTQSRFVVANKAMLDAGSMSTMDEIVGKTDFDFHPTEIAQKFYDKEQQLLATGEKFINEEEVAFDFQTGDKLWFLTTKMPLRDVQGNITGLIGVSRNITQRKQFEEKLQEERALLRTLIDSSPDYIFIKDTQGRYVINNIAHARSVNATPKDLIGKTVLDVLPSNIAAQVHVDDEHVLKSGKPLINLERVTLNEDGATRMMLVTKIPLHDENGQVTGLVGISRDITDRKQLDARTLELAAERERILVLQRLISDLSHDLRTPLTIINNSLYLLHKIPDPQKQQPHLERMEAQVLRLDKLLGELLQMAQLDQQGTDLELDQAELNSLMKTLLREYESIAIAKQVAIEFAPDGDVCFAYADTPILVRALVSLLENAVTYTPDGGRIVVRTSTEENNQTLISVQDSGVGIKANDLPHIFERFYRADQARSTHTGGHGLGLSIALRIVEAHQGSIQVESAPNKGSRFTILLPTTAPD